MPSYRFCRPDDIPLLVHAVETCYRVHDPAEPQWTADSFRRGMREIDLWPSNSMVALDTDGEPVAVMVGTKRPDAVAVHRLGVRPDHRRRGHGVHLLTSLSQKLAVLGPDRLVAEVPDDRPAALACFAAAGYTREATLIDWERPAGEGPGGEAVPEGLVEELTVADLDAAGVLADGPAVAWCRTRRTLLQSADTLSAVAVLSPERVEGWVVFRRPEGAGGAASEAAARVGRGLHVLAIGAAESGDAPLLLGVLFRWLTARHPRSMVVGPRLAAGELPPDVLRAHGFAPGRSYALLAATAKPL